MQRELAARNVPLRVAAVLGDDVAPSIDRLRREGSVKEMWTGEPLPEEILTANAYLGAFPIARALQLGADIVVTGRCADSALALGPLIWGATAIWVLYRVIRGALRFKDRQSIPGV